MKTFYQQDNIGRAKYTVNFHNGIDTHKDGSPFFAIKIYRNKRKLNKFISELNKEGYVNEY